MATDRSRNALAVTAKGCRWSEVFGYATDLRSLTWSATVWWDSAARMKARMSSTRKVPLLLALSGLLGGDRGGGWHRGSVSIGRFVAHCRHTSISITAEVKSFVLGPVDARKPSSNFARLAPNPRQFERGSYGFRRFQAANWAQARPPHEALNTAKTCGKQLKQAKESRRTKDPGIWTGGFQDRCIQPLCHPSRASDERLVDRLPVALPFTSPAVSRRPSPHAAHPSSSRLGVRSKERWPRG
jgi:hypothetical protein